MKLKELETILNNLYEPWKYHDAIPSGLLIEGNSDIKTGITGVSFSKELVSIAIKKHADFIVVHHAHGFWNNQPKIITGGFKEKIHEMLDNKISLFGYHLPMDGHSTLGNNISILNQLDLNLKKDIIVHENILIGEYKKSIPYHRFLKLISNKIGKLNFSFGYGTASIKTVAICSGGGASLIREAKNTGADIFLTGEAKEDTFIFCKDENFNFIAAGHHNTEKFGVQKLASYLTNYYKIPTKFVNIPNII